MKLVSFLFAALIAATSLSGANYDHHIHNAHNSLKTRNFKQAHHHLNQVIQENPNHSQAHELKGHISFAEGNSSEAISHLSRAIEANPKNSTAYFDRGVAHLSQGNTEQATKDIRIALELNPKLHERLKQADPQGQTYKAPNPVKASNPVKKTVKKSAPKKKNLGLHSISMKKGTVKIKKGIVAFRSKGKR